MSALSLSGDDGRSVLIRHLKPGPSRPTWTAGCGISASRCTRTWEGGGGGYLEEVRAGGGAPGGRPMALGPTGVGPGLGHLTGFAFDVRPAGIRSGSWRDHLPTRLTHTEHTYRRRRPPPPPSLPTPSPHSSHLYSGHVDQNKRRVWSWRDPLPAIFLQSPDKIDFKPRGFMYPQSLISWKVSRSQNPWVYQQCITPMT